MELSGNQLMAAPRHVVWQALLDPTTLQRCIPGCEDVSRVSDEETHVRLLVRLGPVRARFTGKMFMSDVEPAQRCKLTFEGVGGAAGSARGVSEVELADEEGGTRLTYSVAASVGGKLGQIGGRLIDSSAKKMADEFFSALRQQISEEGRAADTGADDVPAGTSPATVTTPPGLSTSPTSPTSPTFPTLPAPSAWPGGRLMPELYRVGWFALGVLTTLLLTHLS